jgi:hypothetical protein
MQSFFANGFYVVSIPSPPPAPPWNPTGQFSSLIFWIDAKQTIAGVDYNTLTKSLISWTDQVSGNNLIPDTDTAPIFIST